MSVRQLLLWFRAHEVALMTGFALCGALFAVDRVSLAFVGTVLWLFAAVFFLFFAIYAFNSWAGFKLDVSNPRQGHLVGASARAYAWAAIGSGALGLALFASLDPRLAMGGAVSLVLWTLYSLPKIGLRCIPLAGTALHFVSEILHFHLGYLPFQSASMRSLAISCYFGLLFSAGHLHHEVIDYDADLSAGVRTSAVVLGRRRAVRLSFVVFAGAAALMAMLYRVGFVDAVTATPFLAAFGVQVLGWLWHRRDPSNVERAMAYRALYRTGYLLAGGVLGARLSF